MEIPAPQWTSHVLGAIKHTGFRKNYALRRASDAVSTDNTETAKRTLYTRAHRERERLRFVTLQHDIARGRQRVAELTSELNIRFRRDQNAHELADMSVYIVLLQQAVQRLGLGSPDF